MTFTHALATNNYGPQKFIVSSSAATGTHTTIAAAIAAASSGDIIFIREGTYTEDLTLKAGVGLCSNDGNNFGNVTIAGKLTFTTDGSVVISGMNLQTNGDFCIAVTGSADSGLFLKNCYVSATNHTAISYTSSGTSSGINIDGCNMNLGTTGIALWSASGANAIAIYDSELGNSGGSTTASNTSATSILMNYSTCNCPLSTSSTGSYQINNSILYNSLINATALTTTGTNTINLLSNCTVTSGTASCLSIGASTAVQVTLTTLSSSNTNVLTGAGTLTYAYLAFSGPSSGHNVTTETALSQLT